MIDLVQTMSGKAPSQRSRSSNLSSSSFTKNSFHIGSSVEDAGDLYCRIRHNKKKKEGGIVRTPLKRRLDEAVRGFLSDVGCFVSNTSSKAVCNDTNSSTSFVILDGTASLSLGEFSGSISGGGEANSSIMKEVCDRWKNRMEICMSLGNVVCKENENDVLKIYRFDTVTENKARDNTTATQESIEESIFYPQSLNSDDDADNKNSYQHTLVTKAMPRVTFRKRAEWNINIDANSYLPKNHIAALNHLMEHEFDQAVEKFEEIHLADKKIFGEHHLIAGVSSHNLGMAHLLAGHEGRSIYYFHRAVFIKRAALSPNDPLLAHSLIEVGNLLYARNDYKSALSIYLEAKAVLGDPTKKLSREDCTQQNDVESSAVCVWPSLLSSIYNNMGCIQTDLGLADDALKHFERSLELQRIEMKSSPNAERSLLNISVTQFNIGYINLRSGLYEEAILMLEEALLVQESVLKDSFCDDTQSNSNEVQKHHQQTRQSTSDTWTADNSSRILSSVTIQNTKAIITLCKRIGDMR